MPLHNQQGAVTAILSIARDVTTRREMERALRELDRPLPALVGEQRRLIEQVADVEKLTG